MIEKYKIFFEKNQLCIEAASSLKNGREIELRTPSQSYTFVKISNKNQLEGRQANKPDVVFSLSENILNDLTSKTFDSVGEVGLFLFQKILSDNKDEKITISIRAGFLSLLSGGYLGILSAGGLDLAKYLGTKGFGSLGKIKDAIRRASGD